MTYNTLAISQSGAVRLIEMATDDGLNFYTPEMGEDLVAAQILLTLGDTEERHRYLNARATPDPKFIAVKAGLKAAGVDALVDDHSMWIADIRRGADLARWFGVGVFLLIAAAAAGVVAFATRAGLASRREVVETLHLTGAEDGFIAQLFQARFARIAAVAGLFGAAGAAIMGAGLRLIGGGAGLTPVLPIHWMDLLAVLPCPLAAAVVAALAARFTAVALIREMA